MTSTIVAVFCNISAHCVTVNGMFHEPPTPAACQRALEYVMPKFLETSPGYTLESQRCEGRGDGA